MSRFPLTICRLGVHFDYFIWSFSSSPHLHGCDQLAYFFVPRGDKVHDATDVSQHSVQLLSPVPPLAGGVLLVLPPRERRDVSRVNKVQLPLFFQQLFRVFEQHHNGLPPPWHMPF